MDYLAVAACFKNEAPYLKEWIEFHLASGVERFVLYNNSSTDSFAEVLAPYVEKGTVRLFNTDMRGCQLACYYNAAAFLYHAAHWVAFIDCDEFLYCPTGADLKDFLRDFEEHPAVGASWSVFGSSGHVSRPLGLVIQNFIRCAPQTWEVNRHIKSILQPKYVICPAGNPHSFMYNSPVPSVDENRVPLSGYLRDASRAADNSVKKIRLNHYFTKSREEWELKRARAMPLFADNGPNPIRQSSDFEFHDRNEVLDTAIWRFMPALKRRLGFAEAG